MGGRGAALVIAAVLGVAGSGTASAQPAPSARDEGARDPKAAKRWLHVGHQLMQRGSYLVARNRPDDAKPQFENAAAAFAKAIEASDDVNVYLELAIAEEKLGKLDAAIKHVRRVVDTKAGVRPDVATRATSKLEQLLTRVGLVTLNVVPSGTSITLGGAELGTSPLPEPLVLVPGTYTLSFQADGFQPREAELEVEPGSESERTIELEPVRVIVEPVKPVEREVVVAVATPRPPSRTPLHVGAGVAGAAALGASVFGILAVRQHASFTDPSTSTAARDDARSRGKQLALLTDVSLATAAAAAGFTAYWYIFRYRRDSRSLAGDPAGDRGHNPIHNRAKLDPVPWVQPESAGVALAGSF